MSIWDRSISLFLAAFFVLSLISTFSLMVSPAKADVPSVASLSYSVLGGVMLSPAPDGYLMVSVRHASSSADDIVDKIEVNKSGTVTEVDAPDIDYQTTGTFTIQVYMGKDADVQASKPTVQVRAHSTVDGWSAWSDSFVVPESADSFEAPEFSGLYLVSACGLCRIGCVVEASACVPLMVPLKSAFFHNNFGTRLA